MPPRCGRGHRFHGRDSAREHEGGDGNSATRYSPRLKWRGAEPPRWGWPGVATPAHAATQPHMIIVAGTGMNAGKTTVAAMSSARCATGPARIRPETDWHRLRRRSVEVSGFGGPGGDGLRDVGLASTAGMDIRVSMPQSVASAQQSLRRQTSSSPNWRTASCSARQACCSSLPTCARAPARSFLLRPTRLAPRWRGIACQLGARRFRGCWSDDRVAAGHA